jgi:hypothetical protein
MTGNNEPPRVYQVGELSPDGAHFWDGSTWKSAISADGRYMWDGSSWQPNMASPPGQPASAVPPKQSHTTRNVVIVVVVLLLFGGCITVAAVSGGSKSSSSATPTPATTLAATPAQPTSTPKVSTPTPVFQPVTLQGSGSAVQPANLPKGLYRVDWAVDMQGKEATNFIVKVVGTGPGESPTYLLNELPGSAFGGPTKGQKTYNAGGGTYQVEVQTTVAWSMTFTRIGG